MDPGPLTSANVLDDGAGYTVVEDVLYLTTTNPDPPAAPFCASAGEPGEDPAPPPPPELAVPAVAN